MSVRFARGAKALGICDRCGQTNKLSELRFQVVNQKPTGLRVCPACLDQDHPQLQLGKFPINDPTALRDPRPDIDPGTGLFGWNPVANPAQYIASYVGTVTVQTGD